MNRTREYRTCLENKMEPERPRTAKAQNRGCMPTLEKVAEATNTFASHDEMHAAFIQKNIDLTTANGYRFWGLLEKVDGQWLYIRGYKGQMITIRRSKVSSIMEAV
jgi:hypothetical protein